MLKPIPFRILSQNAEIKVASSVDEWQKVTYTTYTILHVHLQNTNEVRKTTNNTEVVLTSILFIDGRLSSPQYDFNKLENISQENGSDMKAMVDGITYTVQSVDAVPDDTGQMHHWELGLI